MKDFAIISACDQNYGIGINNRLPWNLPSELKYFQDVTQDSTVIMGRNTWESLPPKSKPLSNRQNIVISRNADFALPESVILSNSIDQALQLAIHSKIFIIGGAKLYKLAIQHQNCRKIYLTKINSIFECDTFFPGTYLESNFEVLSKSSLQQENDLEFTFIEYKRIT
jgi:dihydrofolate reductase